MINKKLKINKCCILIFILIYFSKETYLIGANKEGAYIFAKYIMDSIILLFGLFYTIIKKKKITKNILLTYLLCVGLLVVSEIFSESFGLSL